METTKTAIKPQISFDTYQLMDIRVCEIISAEKVEKKDKLYKLTIDTGVDTRVVVSGIAEQFSIEQILNKKFPFILNLPPRPIAGIESNGMIILSEGSNQKYYALGDENTEVGAIVV